MALAARPALNGIGAVCRTMTFRPAGRQVLYQVVGEVDGVAYVEGQRVEHEQIAGNVERDGRLTPDDLPSWSGERRASFEGIRNEGERHGSGRSAETQQRGKCQSVRSGNACSLLGSRKHQREPLIIFSTRNT